MTYNKSSECSFRVERFEEAILSKFKLDRFLDELSKTNRAVSKLSGDAKKIPCGVLRSNESCNRNSNVKRFKM